jgi:hypothetical protein
MKLSSEKGSISYASNLIDKKIIRNKSNNKYIEVEKTNATYKQLNELVINS